MHEINIGFEKYAFIEMFLLFAALLLCRQGYFNFLFIWTVDSITGCA